MATNNRQRMINTRFWSDSFIVDKLNPLDRYLFLYFLTNEKTNLSGVYELSIRTIANETGLEKEEVLRMLERLKGKVEYQDGWVCLVNFTKHQNTENGSIVKGIENRINELPIDVRKWVDKLRKSTTGRPLVDHWSTSGEQPNLTKPNLTKEATLPLWLDKDSWNEWITYRKGRKLTNSRITLDKQIELLEKYKSTHKAIIEKSITNGWQGLFPERDASKKASNIIYVILDTRSGKQSTQTFISEQEAKKFINMKSEWNPIKDKLKVIPLTEKV